MFLEINALLTQYDLALQAHSENHEMGIEVSESKISCSLDNNPPNQHAMVMLNFVIEMMYLKCTHIQFFLAGRGSPDPPTTLGAKLRVSSELGMFFVPLACCFT